MQHLMDLQIAPSLVTTQWLLTAFVGSSLPLEVLLEVWDTFFTERHVSFLFRLAAALLITNRDKLLASTDTGAVYSQLTNLGKDVTHLSSANRLLDTARALGSRPMLTPDSIQLLRQQQAERLESEHGIDVASVARAAVATVTATDAELRQLALTSSSPCGESSSCGTAWLPVGETSASQSGWDSTILPESCLPPCEKTKSSGVDQLEEDLEEWNLVGQPLPPHTCSLSYVILMMEAPKLLEGHFQAVSSTKSSSGDMSDLHTARARLDSMQPVHR